MKNYPFPIFKTKTAGVRRKFKLEDPKEREIYFKAKAGREIAKIKKYLKKNVFMGILLGKKNSGKGTYIKLFMEAIGPERIAHISLGDIVRSTHKEIGNPDKKKNLIKFLDSHYRGFITTEKALDIIEGRDTKTLLPTEIVLALLEREIDRVGRKAIFIDGFPRTEDQLSYSLFLRALMGYRNDPDFLVFIDVPEQILDQRIKTRVVCPTCQTPRSLRVLRTKEVGYDEKTKEFYLICDNSNCSTPQRMIPKEGDSLGIEGARDRMETDEKIMRKLLDIKGIPKVLLRNPIPASVAKKYVDDYEITPAYKYRWDSKNKKVVGTEEFWTIRDDENKKAYSLLPTAVTIGLIKQIAKVLEL
jgi:adenylate kinase family enzyme